MLTINIHEAKTHLSRFVEQAAAGEEIIIAKAGKPLAKLVPLHNAPSHRNLGMFKGQLNVPDNFDAPLSHEVICSFKTARLNRLPESLNVRLLLDTHILLWALDTPERLPHLLREQLESAHLV